MSSFAFSFGYRLHDRSSARIIRSVTSTLGDIGHRKPRRSSRSFAFRIHRTSPRCYLVNQFRGSLSSRTSRSDWRASSIFWFALTSDTDRPSTRSSPRRSVRGGSVLAAVESQPRGSAIMREYRKRGKWTITAGQLLLHLQCSERILFQRWLCPRQK